MFVTHRHRQGGMLQPMKNCVQALVDTNSSTLVTNTTWYEKDKYRTCALFIVNWKFLSPASLTQ